MSCGCNINIYNTGGSSGETYSASSLGAGEPIFAGEVVTGSDTEFQFKSIVAGANVTLTSNGDELTITSAGPDGGVTFLDQVGGGSQLAQSITGQTLNLRTITGGSGITATQNTDTVSIANTGLLTATNIGPGAGLIPIPIVGGNLQVRSFVGTAAVNVSQTANTINISSPVNTLTSLPGGQSLIGTALPTATLRSLIGGIGISLASSPDNITINNTQTPTNTVTNLGGAANVLIDVLAGSVRARTLISQGYALVNQSGNNITIGARGPVNIGSGEPIFSGNVGFDNQYKSLSSLGNIQITSDPSNIYFKPLINNVIPYSGKTILNTYLSGNPELSDFLGFGSNVPITSIDAFPADYPTLPTAFVGWVAPYRCRIILADAFIKFSIPTTISEQLDIYCAIHRCKENDTGMNLIWFDQIFSTTSNISVGDFIQRTFTPNVDVDIRWHLYFSFFAHRPNAAGSTDLIEFYTSSSITVQSSDSL